MASSDPEPDEVDGLVAAWRRERPDLNLAPMEVLSRVTRLAYRVDRHRAEAFGAHGLEAYEFDVLAALRRSGEPFSLSPGQLVRETLVTSGTMTNRVDRLAARGLVEREDHPDDRRGVLVRLTDAGRAKVDAALADLLAAERTILAPLSGPDQDQLVRDPEATVEVVGLGSADHSGTGHGARGTAHGPALAIRTQGHAQFDRRRLAGGQEGAGGAGSGHQRAHRAILQSGFQHLSQSWLQVQSSRLKVVDQRRSHGGRIATAAARSSTPAGLRKPDRRCPGAALSSRPVRRAGDRRRASTDRGGRRPAPSDSHPAPEPARPARPDRCPAQFRPEERTARRYRARRPADSAPPIRRPDPTRRRRPAAQPPRRPNPRPGHQPPGSTS